jgi:hypothetical protein
MKIFNISDVETKKLKQRGLVLHTVVVGKQLLSPGDSVEISAEEAKAFTAGIEELVELGVLAIDMTPKGYAQAEKAKPAPAKEEPAKDEKEEAASASSPKKMSFPPSKKYKDG